MWCAARAVVQGEREAGGGSGQARRGREPAWRAQASGSEAEGKQRKEGGREKKKEKEKRERKENGKKEKEIEEKKMGGRERKEKEGGGKRWCAPAATATAVGHTWRAAAGGGGTRSEEREEKGEGKKEGRDSRRPVTTRRVGWDRDGTRIEFGCRVIQERLWGLGFRV